METLALTSATPSNWTANTGTATTAVAADDSDTTYIDTSLGLNHQFSVADTSVGTSETIPYVRITGSFRKTSAASASVNAYITDGTNTVYGGTQEITSQSYATYYWDFTGVPAKTGAWTTTDLNSLEVGIVGDNTNIRCTYLVVQDEHYASGVFQYDKPHSYEDSVGGKICKMTGMWAPAHSLEGDYIAEYAPHDRTRGIQPKRPRTGKT